MTAIIYHRRNPLRPRGGNQFYRDRSERAVSTVCGAPVTEYDAAHWQRGNDWVRQSDGQEFIACRECWPEKSP